MEGWGVCRAQSSQVDPASLVCRCLSPILVHPSARGETGSPWGGSCQPWGCQAPGNHSSGSGESVPRAGESIWKGGQQGCAGATVPQREG